MHYSRSKVKLAPDSGWTFVEMLVAVTLSTVCLGAGALALQSIVTSSRRATSLIEIDIGSTNNQNFYGSSGSIVGAYIAPNYGKLAYAQMVRDTLQEDALKSTAIFCLPRSLPNTIRPEALPAPSGRPKLDSPDSFRKFLIDFDSTAATVYGTASFRNVPPADKPNTTIFLLGSSADAGEIQVNAIYEIDFVTPSNHAGTYASVRKYVGDTLTAYYDIFYKPGNGDSFYPQFVAFEQISRRAANESNDLKRFQIAPRGPFYLLWLPDPSINPYLKPKVTVTDATSSPRYTYAKMSGKTAFSVVLPQSPTL